MNIGVRYEQLEEQSFKSDVANHLYFETVSASSLFELTRRHGTLIVLVIHVTLSNSAKRS